MQQPEPWVNLVFGIQKAYEGRFTTVGGGLPIVIENRVVGGIGCSGGTPEQDMACANAALDLLGANATITSTSDNTQQSNNSVDVN
jgi:uncharacterized protein GlcG (DUF336 family)